MSGLRGIWPAQSGCESRPWFPSLFPGDDCLCGPVDHKLACSKLQRGGQRGHCFKTAREKSIDHKCHLTYKLSNTTINPYRRYCMKWTSLSPSTEVSTEYGEPLVIIVLVVDEDRKAGQLGRRTESNLGAASRTSKRSKPTS